MPNYTLLQGAPVTIKGWERDAANERKVEGLSPMEDPEQVIQKLRAANIRRVSPPDNWSVVALAALETQAATIARRAAELEKCQLSHDRWKARAEDAEAQLDAARAATKEHP